MKAFIRLFMAIHVGLYRLTHGKIGGSMGKFKLLLLTTKGRKSGKERTLPLGFFSWQSGYLIVASNGGQPTHPAWYHNLTSNPQAQIELFEISMPVTAEILTGETRSQAWQHVISVAPSYAPYEKQTTREIPLVLLHPKG